jgi:hypothetical protein
MGATMELPGAEAQILLRGAAASEGRFATGLGAARALSRRRLDARAAPAFRRAPAPALR